MWYVIFIEKWALQKPADDPAKHFWTNDLIQPHRRMKFMSHIIPEIRFMGQTVKHHSSKQSSQVQLNSHDTAFFNSPVFLHELNEVSFWRLRN